MTSDNTQPFLSIITVCKNSVETIDHALRSVEEQKGVDGIIEHIIVDGGSTDGTLDVIKNYPNVKCISENDNGISHAFNKGIMRASGNVIGFVHSDDKLFDEYSLKKIISAFYAYPDAKIIVGKLALDGVLQEFAPSTLQNIYCALLTKIFRVRNADILGGYIPHPATFIKKYVYEEFGLYREDFSIAMDYELILRLRKARVSIHQIDEIIYSMSSGGISTTRSIDAAFEAYRAGRLNGVAWYLRFPRLLSVLMSRIINSNHLKVK